ncbi:MAG: dihydroneopterin aldolase [Thermoplasmatota archaeon]
MPRLAGAILLRGIRSRCVIGERDWERRRRQRVRIDVELETDLGRAAATDDLAQAIDYKAVKDRVRAHAAASRFHLLEALADSVARLVLEDARVQAVQVTVDKPGALSGARSVAVRVARRRG